MVNEIYWLVVSNMAGLFSISDMGCHPKPIDELHHFSEGWLNHKPDEPELVCQSLPELVSLFCISHLFACLRLRSAKGPSKAHDGDTSAFLAKVHQGAIHNIAIYHFFLPVNIPHLWWLNLNSIPFIMIL